VLWTGGQVVIDQIDHDSPAAKAGIREKDAALKLDGQDVAKMRLNAFRLQLCNSTDMVRLTVRRGEQVLELPVVLPHANAIVEVSARIP
jgi:S1-C subfamily serine protease